MKTEKEHIYHHSFSIFSHITLYKAGNSEICFPVLSRIVMWILVIVKLIESVLSTIGANAS